MVLLLPANTDDAPRRQTLEVQSPCQRVNAKTRWAAALMRQPRWRDGGTLPDTGILRIVELTPEQSLIGLTPRRSKPVHLSDLEKPACEHLMRQIWWTLQFIAASLAPPPWRILRGSGRISVYIRLSRSDMSSQHVRSWRLRFPASFPFRTRDLLTLLVSFHATRSLTDLSGSAHGGRDSDGAFCASGIPIAPLIELPHGRPCNGCTGKLQPANRHAACAAR
jgi:hypothetical protein